jgi:prophage DNA circulation protein
VGKFGDGVSGITDKVSGITDKVRGITDKVSGITDKVSGITDKVSGITETNDKEMGSVTRTACREVAGVAPYVVFFLL